MPDYLINLLFLLVGYLLALIARVPPRNSSPDSPRETKSQRIPDSLKAVFEKKVTPRILVDPSPEELNETEEEKGYNKVMGKTLSKLFKRTYGKL
jgi:hypothetical protein